MNRNGFEQTIRLLTSNRLFSGGFPEKLPDGTEIVTSLEDAMILANEQDLPDGYRIWEDVQENAIASFRTTKDYHDAVALIDPVAHEVWTATKKTRLDLRKKQIRETLTQYEEFVTTLAGDVLEQLKIIAAGQICEKEHLDSVLQAMLFAYSAGFYPCGWSEGGNIVVYDPRRLDGFRENILSH